MEPESIGTDYGLQEIASDGNDDEDEDEDEDLNLLDREDDDLQQIEDLPANLDDSNILDNDVIEHLRNFEIPQDRIRDYNAKVSMEQNRMTVNLVRTEMPLNQHSSEGLSASWTNDGSSPSWTNDRSSPSWTNNRFSPSWTNYGSSQ